MLRIVDIADGLSVEDTVEQVRDALETHRVVHVRAGDQNTLLRDYWSKVVAGIGTRYTQTESRTGHDRDQAWTDVRFDPEHSSTFRYSKTAQPLHTDGAYVDGFPDTVGLLCERAASTGGATIFLDAERLIEVLGEENSVLLEELQTVPVCFSKTRRGVPGKTKPIITFDEEGPHLTWNYYRVEGDQGEQVRALRERFHTFLQERFIDRGEVVPVLLKEGDAVLFWDERVLHGRDSFEVGGTEDRCLWKFSVHSKDTAA